MKGLVQNDGRIAAAVALSWALLLPKHADLLTFATKVLKERLFIVFHFVLSLAPLWPVHLL